MAFVNDGSTCNILKYQDKIDMGTVFAFAPDFSISLPDAFEAPSPDPSPSGTPTSAPSAPVALGQCQTQSRNSRCRFF